LLLLDIILLPPALRGLGGDELGHGARDCLA